MFDWLARTFVEDHEAVKKPEVRERYGRLTGTVGIVVNLLLFAIKLTTGLLIRSIALTGDALNNLSDAGAAIVSLVSFKLSARPADEDHPFGHARMEYVASSVVAVIILLMGLELFRTSLERISNPEPIVFSFPILLLLLAAIFAKIWLSRFYLHYGRILSSTMMKATATDSISDVMATSAVLLSMVISPLIGIQLDGWVGLVVSGFIAFSGINVLKETINRILGQGPSQELMKMIEGYILKFDGVIGIHDLVVHEYGPNRYFASVHVEVDAKIDILTSHDRIDLIEHGIREEHDIRLVIHLDPVIRDDPFVNDMRTMAEQAVLKVDHQLLLHDFRVVKAQTHSKLIFEVTVPFDCKRSNTQMLSDIRKNLNAEANGLYPIVTFDRAFL